MKLKFLKTAQRGMHPHEGVSICGSCSFMKAEEQQEQGGANVRQKNGDTVVTVTCHQEGENHPNITRTLFLLYFFKTPRATERVASGRQRLAAATRYNSWSNKKKTFIFYQEVLTMPLMERSH